MMTLQDAANMLLQNAIAVIPIAIVVAVLCRTIKMRPATRHTLWLGVLVFLIIPPTLPEFSRTLLERTTPAADLTTARLEPLVMDKPIAAEPETTEIAPALTQEKPIERLAPKQAPAPRIELVRDVDPNPLRFAEVPRIEYCEKPARVLRSEPISVPRQDIAQASTPGDSHWAAFRAVSTRTQSSEPELAAAEPTSKPEVLVEDPTPAQEFAFGSIPVEPVSKLGAVQFLFTSSADVAGHSLQIAQDRGAALYDLGYSKVRAAVNAVPTVPAWLWFGGVCTVAVIALTRLCLAFRLFRSAERAPESVQSLIRSAATEMGVRRAPRTLMVADRVSPMVWCGLRTTLVLPHSLWSELDAEGRRAVVQHELAHIKRRDHWVRWVEMLISTLYWWHPIVWWARRRVREEADLSCDLWVTALMPNVRAPYARALLMTKQYVSSGGIAVPSVGIGAVSPGAKRFSRRITMVMTTRMSPKNSIVGVALAAALVLGGVYSAPGWACPTEKEPKPAMSTQSPEDSSDLSTFEQYMIERAPEPGQSTSPSDCDQAAQASAPEDECRSSRVTTTLGNIHGRVQSLVNGQVGYANTIALYNVGDTSVHPVTYKLPKDRLNKLTKLMVREDVPILVEPVDGGLLVHGNAEQHRRFAAFVAVLNPKDNTVSYRMDNSGKLNDLTNLMALSTVPTLIYKDTGAIRVKGNTNTQRAFADFVDMIDPTAGHLRHDGSDHQDQMVFHNQHEHPLRNEAAKVEMRVKGMFDEAERLRAIELTLEQQADAVEHQAEELERQAEDHRDQAEQILEEVEAMLDEAEELTESQQYEVMVHAEAAQNEASRIMRLADVIESQIEMVLAQTEPILDQAASFGEQADRLEEQAEELADSLEEQIEDLEDELESRYEEFDNWATEHAEALHSLLQEHAERLDHELSQRLERLTR